MATRAIFTLFFGFYLVWAFGSPLNIQKKRYIPKAQKILVIKSKRELYLLRGGKIYKEYDISLGRNPKGKKIKSHDKKTPEGNYTIDFKLSNSKYYKALHISYPSKEDRARAKRLGVEPGGDIMIHGQPNMLGWLSFILQRFDWTAGCIALSNSDIDELWSAIRVNTPI